MQGLLISGNDMESIVTLGAPINDAPSRNNLHLRVIAGFAFPVVVDVIPLETIACLDKKVESFVS